MERKEVEEIIKECDADLAADIEQIKSEIKGIKNALARYNIILANLNYSDRIITDSLEMINNALKDLSKEE